LPDPELPVDMAGVHAMNGRIRPSKKRTLSLMRHSKKRRRGNGRRIEELVAEVFIAVAIVGLALFYADQTPPANQVDFRWIALAVTTAITFGYPVKCPSQCRTFCGYLWFAIAMPFEWAVVSRVLEETIQNRKRRS
jgi:hypothetical protein